MSLDNERAREPVIVELAQVERQDVHFLWRPYLPLGKLVLLEGDPSAGKTFLALAVAANVTRGRSFRDADGVEREDVLPPANVLYLTAEDGLADTLRPRLESLGADLSRVKSIEGPVTLADLGVLERAFARVLPALVVLDPLQGFLGGELDNRRVGAVRPTLAALARLAEKQGCTVLALRHLTKSSTSRTLYRGLGSIDFTAAARSVLLAGEDPRSGRHAFVHLKSSLAPVGPAVGYALGAEGFEWTGVSELTAADLTAAEPSGADRGKGALDEAAQFLVEFLQDGPRSANETQRLAKRAGISVATLRRAKLELSVRAIPENSGGRGVQRWLWSLPEEHLDEGAQDMHVE